MKLPQIFYSKLFFLSLIIAILIMSGIEFRQWRVTRKVNQEIANLSKQEQELINQNKDLQSNIDFLKSPEYQDKISRTQYNLKKDGEIVVDLSEPKVSNTNENQNPQKESNINMWWKYLFN